MSLGSYSFSQNALLVVLVLASRLQYSHAAASLNFPTPTNLIVCNTTTLAWTGGTGPYTLEFDINGETLESAFIFNDFSLDWQVDVGPGFPVVITLSDGAQHTVTTPPLYTKLGNETCDLVTPSPSSSSSSPSPTGGNGGQFDGLGSSSSSSRTVVTASGGASAHSTNASGSAAGAQNTDGTTSDDKISHSSGAVIGIIIAVVGVLIALSVVGLLLYRRSKNKRNRARVDLLAESSYPRPYDIDMNYGRQPLPSASFDVEPKPMMVSPQMGPNYSNPMVAFPFPEPSPPPAQQPTYSEKVAMMRRPKGAPSATFSTNRTGEPSASGSAPTAPSSSGSSVVYARSEYSSSTSQLSAPTSTRRSKHHGLVSSPSIRTTESEVSEMSASGASASTANLIPSNAAARREADGGVRLAGGPRESWFAGSGTLPPAYGDF